MYAEGLRVTDIARQLRIDKSTASRTLQRAKKNIAHIMETRTALDKLRDENRLDMADPKAVQLLMGVLTAHQAVCFYLYYSEWLSIRQIGELLDVDHSTICRTIQRAVARINDILGGGIGILDNIEGMDDVVFSIYRGLSAECDELPPVVRGHFSAEPSADYVAKTRRAWGTVAPAITPRFQICGNPGARHGQLDPDQHGYLFQALQKRYEGIRLKHHGHENNWALAREGVSDDDQTVYILVGERRLTMEYQKVFPKKLQVLREKRRLSRHTLSELCGLSRNVIGMYERGEKAPSVDALVSLSDYFGVSVDYLLGREKKF